MRILAIVRDPKTRSLAILCAIVIAVHLLILALFVNFYEKHGVDFETQIMSQDSGPYIELGQSLLTEGRFVMSGASADEAFRTPGYPLFVAIMLAISGGSFWFLFVAQALLAAGISLITYALARTVDLSHKVSYAIGLVIGISPALVLETVTGMGGDVLYTLLFAAAALLLMRGAQKHTYRYVIGIGVILGIATLVRPIGLYASLPLFAAMLFLVPAGASIRERLLKVLVALALFLLIITPWMLRNYVNAGHFSLSTVPGYNLVFYNMPQFLAWKKGTSIAEERAILTAPYAEATYDQMHGFLYTDEITNMTKRILKEEGLFSYLYFHTVSMVPFFIGSGLNVIGATASEPTGGTRIPFLTPPTPYLSDLVQAHNWSGVVKNLSASLPVTAERLVWALLLMCVLISPLFARGHIRIFLLFCIVIIFANAFLTSPVTQPRYRLPVEPFIFIGAAYMLSFGVQRIMRRLWKNRTS